MKSTIRLLFFSVLLLILCATAQLWATGTQETVDGSTPVKIHWIHRFWGDACDPDNYFETTVAEKLNIDLDFDLIPASELGQKYNVLIASGDMPHIMPVWRNADFFKWADQGVFADLSEHWNEFPNLVEQYPDDLLDISTRVKGEIYGICHVVPEIARFLGIRTDWLETVGLEPPTNLDELMTIARAFTFNDPDGDGKDNTWAFGLDGGLAEPHWFLAPTFHIHTISADGLYPVGDSTVEASIWQPGFKAYVEFLRDAYAEGIINPESLTFTAGSQIETDLFWAGKTGMTGVLSGSVSKWEIQLRENYPDASIVLVDLLEGPFGEPKVVTQAKVWSNYVVTSAVDDRQLLKAMELLDWIASEEGAHFMSYGKEGVHWTETNEEGIPIVTDKWHSDRWANIWRGPNRPQAPISIIRPSERANEYAKRMLDTISMYKKHAVDLPSRKLPELPQSLLQVSELTPMLKMAVLKITTGEEDISHLDGVIEEINRRGLMQAIEDVNAMIAELE